MHQKANFIAQTINIKVKIGLLNLNGDENCDQSKFFLLTEGS